VHHCTPSPYTVFGQKGSGESGYLGAPAAISNAINDAVRSLGILMAAERGYFAAAGLDVTVSHARLGHSPVTDLAEEHADLAIEIMPVALRQRAEGAEVVHIAQFFQRGTLTLICRPEIDQPGKLAGRNVGVWLGGWESGFYAWLNRLGLSYFASGGGVTILRQGPDAEAFLARETDCFTTTSYLAPLQLARFKRRRVETQQRLDLALQHQRVLVQDLRHFLLALGQLPGHTVLQQGHAFAQRGQRGFEFVRHMA